MSFASTTKKSKIRKPKEKKEVFHCKKNLNQKMSFSRKKLVLISSFLKHLNFAMKPLSIMLVDIFLANHFLSFSWNLFLVSFSLFIFHFKFFLKRKLIKKKRRKNFYWKYLQIRSKSPRLFQPPSSKQFYFFSADNTKTFAFIKCW